MNYLIILSGPGGSGKNTVINRLLEDKTLNLSNIISLTSRPPRADEAEAKFRRFVTKNEFEDHIKRGNMLEHEIAASTGHYYGTPKTDLEQTLTQFNVICEKMPVGALALKKHFGNQAITIFLDADNQELEKRLHDPSRAHEYQFIQKRLAQAKTERQFKPQYDFSITNHDGELDHTISQIKEFLHRRIMI